MGKIVLLDELTINQIAAGEVIERPASVVKEMVENSIDAGAKNIIVEIKNGGISYIRITDDGKGIARDDVELAFERHATSKIRSATDLQEVKSMGFRGEALASIAAIANVELVSRTAEEEVGTKIVVEGGNVVDLRDVGCGKGTTITVRNLFYNTPVRYKFLKKDFTETGYIEDVISRLSLIHPEIAFKLINAGKVCIQTSGKAGIKGVVYNIYGKDIAEEILEVNYEFENMRVYGVIGKPAIARSNRACQIFFVNSRYIKDKTLTAAAEQAYKGMIPIGKFAFLILNIDMPANKVDVNVHPAKLEVRFSDENAVFQAVYHGIKNRLLNADLISNREIKEASKDTFKIEPKKGLFDKKEEKSNKIEDVSVFDRLKKLQDNLQKQIDLNPRIKLTDDYKKMSQKYNELTTATEKIGNEKSSVSEVISKVSDETKAISTSELTKVIENPKVNDDTKVISTDEVSKAINNLTEETKKIPIISENPEQQVNQIKEEPKLEENSKIEKDEEILNDKKEENEEKQIKDVKAKMDSFEEMYKKLFGKEPYTGKKLEEYPDSTGNDSLTDNLSVFEGMEEYQKPSYKFIGIAFKTYIILEMKQELYIMDQHAAHERILYEKVKKNFYSQTEKQSQMLLLPDVITLTNKEMAIAKENFGMFEKAGFILEEFGENTIKLSGVPDVCIDLDTKELFMETLDEINTVARTAKQEKEEKFIATVACKAAVKANMALNEEEVNSLMNQLLELPNPFSCPHGRPTVIKMSKYDIERKFARK